MRKLAGYGCTQEEIADYFDTSRSVITARFGQAFRLGQSTVRKNVRMWQIRRAKAGSDRMLIHLGQQYCGQAEKIETTRREPEVVKYVKVDNGRDAELHAPDGPDGMVAEPG